MFPQLIFLICHLKPLCSILSATVGVMNFLIKKFEKLKLGIILVLESNLYAHFCPHSQSFISSC